ncbi:YjbF family lipoprotein [Gammaproteobacteria bacterium]|nr:YjbF family lipoprotein [Gammaproteobacteria bacterium]
MNKLSSLVIAACAISSCTNMPYEAVVPAIRSAVIGAEKLVISEDFYNAQKYSFASVRIGRNISAILVLESINDDVYVWTSVGGNKIHTHNGKIIKTLGLERNIELYNHSLFDFNKEESFNFQYDVMLSNPPAFIEVNSELTFDDSKNLYIEKISSKVLAWKKENTYKTNKDGQVIYSKQVFHPFEPSVEMEFYYK